MQAQDVLCLVLKGMQHLKVNIIGDEDSCSTLVPSGVKKEIITVSISGKENPFQVLNRFAVIKSKI